LTRDADLSPLRYRLFLIAAAALFSTGGAVIKMTTLTDWQVASFRSGVAALALGAAMAGVRRDWFGDDAAAEQREALI